jgi:hypothetical protein
MYTAWLVGGGTRSPASRIDSRCIVTGPRMISIHPSARSRRMTSRTFTGRSGGRGVTPTAAVDEAPDRERGGDEGDRGVGGPGQVAARGRRRRRAGRGHRDGRGPWAAWARRRAERRWSGRPGVTQEREWVDVAAAGAGAAGAKAQPAAGTERSEALADRGVRPSADRETAEVEIGGDERAATDRDGHAVVRKRAGEGDASCARGVDRCAGPGGDVDAAALAAGEGRVRREAKGTDDAAAQRPAPRSVRRRRGAGGGRASGRRRTGGVRGACPVRVARQRPAWRDEEGNHEAGDRQRDEDDGVGAWGHVPTVGARSRGAGGCG